jgi:hypothetical protein
MKGARCAFSVFLHNGPFWQSARTLFRPIHKKGTYSDPEVGFWEGMPLVRIDDLTGSGPDSARRQCALIGLPARRSCPETPSLRFLSAVRAPILLQVGVLWGNEPGVDSCSRACRRRQSTLSILKQLDRHCDLFKRKRLQHTAGRSSICQKLFSGDEAASLSWFPL